MLWDFNYLWTSNKKFCSCRNDVIELFVHVISIGILFTVDFVHVHSIIVTTKLPARIPAWENLQEVFAMLVVVVFYLTGGFSFYCLPQVLRFWVGVFYPQFYPTLLCLSLTWGQEHPFPGSSSAFALTELSLLADAWTWTIDVWITRLFIYQLRQWATKYRVTIKLLNIFCLFKVICKDY